MFVYDSPAPEFRLYRAELGPGEVTLPGAGGARIVLCTEGSGTLRASSGTLKVAKGESCYLSAADGAVTASGPAALFIAGSGQVITKTHHRRTVRSQQALTFPCGTGLRRHVRGAAVA